MCGAVQVPVTATVVRGDDIRAAGANLGNHDADHVAGRGAVAA